MSMTRAGGTPKNLFNLGGIADQIVFGRVQNLHFVVDQLHHVFVAELTM